MGNGRERARDWKPTTDGAKTFQMWNSSWGPVLLAWLTWLLPGKKNATRLPWELPSVIEKSYFGAIFCFAAFRKMSWYLCFAVVFKSWLPQCKWERLWTVWSYLGAGIAPFGKTFESVHPTVLLSTWPWGRGTPCMWAGGVMALFMLCCQGPSGRTAAD